VLGKDQFIDFNDILILFIDIRVYIILTIINKKVYRIYVGFKRGITKL